METYTFDYEGAKFTLTHQPCANKEILEMVKLVKLQDGSLPKWYAGTALYLTIPGQQFDMCFVVNPENPLQVYVMDTDGDGGVIERPFPKPEGV